MQIVNNNIYIVRGETPTYTAKVITKSGIPYMLDTNFTDPVIEFIVRPNVNVGDDTYVMKCIQSIDAIHRFEFIPKNIDEVPVNPAGEAAEWNDLTGPAVGDEKKLHRRRVTNGSSFVNEYAYYDTDKWVVYEFKITFTFSYDDTSNMEPKTYRYEISLFSAANVDYDKKIIGNINYKKPLLDVHNFVVGGSLSE